MEGSQFSLRQGLDCRAFHTLLAIEGTLELERQAGLNGTWSSHLVLGSHALRGCLFNSWWHER
jgi:hypothetical protein